MIWQCRSSFTYASSFPHCSSFSCCFSTCAAYSFSACWSFSSSLSSCVLQQSSALRACFRNCLYRAGFFLARAAIRNGLSWKLCWTFTMQDSRYDRMSELRCKTAFALLCCRSPSRFVVSNTSSSLPVGSSRNDLLCFFSILTMQNATMWTNCVVCSSNVAFVLVS